MQRLSAACLVALLTAAPGPLGTQPVGGSVTGTVQGPDGLPVPATVTATHGATGRAYASPASPDGVYRLLNLPPGRYRISPSSEGLAAQVAAVEVRVGTHLVLALRMELETASFSIDVRESTPLVEAATAAAGAVIERAELRNLPLNERLFLPLTLLAGGAHPSAPGSELSTQLDSGFHVAGGRETANNFLLDGIDNNDLYINRIVVSPPLDSVQEFRLHATGYKAEFGRSSGGQVNAVTRSGTRRLRGSAYHYLRNDALDARNFFDAPSQPIPPYRRGQFGGTLGGPLRAGPAFFFAGFEGTRIREAITRTAVVPGSAERGGDLSGADAPPLDPFSGAPFPEGRIPVSRLDPAGSALAGAWPEPNRTDSVQNLVATPLGDGLINQFTGRADRHLGTAGRFFLRYSLGHARAFEPFSDSDVPGFGSHTLDRGQQLAASVARPLSARWLLEARGGFSRLVRQVRHQNWGRDVAAELGIPGLSADPRQAGFPSVNVAGYAGLGDDSALPILRASTTLHASANLTRAAGRHVWKGGAEHRGTAIDGSQGLFGRGQFNFLGALARNPLADLLLGLPTYAIRTVIDNDFRQRARFWNAYLQDDWQPLPGLTVSAGLRYEYNPPAYDADDRFMQFDLDAARLVRPPAGGLGRAGYLPDRNNAAPRIGAAWSPDGRLVLRAAYGVHHDVSVLQANSGLYFNPPYFDLRLHFPSPVSPLRLAAPFPGEGFAPPPSVNALQPDFRTAYVQRWNFGSERSLPGRLVARASYSAAKGTALLRRRNLNQPDPGEGEVDPRRPTRGFANIVLFESGASSTYHSGVFSLERRFASGTGFRAAYTWSKSIDDASAFLGSAGDQAFPQNSRDFRAERGLSSFDQRHRLAASLMHAFRLRHWLARGWRAYAVASVASGRPLTAQLAWDHSNTGNTGGIFGADRPDLAGDPSAGRRGPERLFDTGAFTAPAPLSFGNAGRNILTGPAGASLDVALVRSFLLSERASAELRGEAFNVANRVNLALPERTFGLPSFGRALAAGRSRQIQLGLRFSF